MAWRKEQPTDSMRFSEIPEVLTENFVAIQNMTEVEHYSIDVSASSANSGKHIAGSASIAYEGTTAEIAAVGGASGAIAFNTTTGLWERHTGTVWANCRQTYWPRARYYFGTNTTIALTANTKMFVGSAIGCTKEYDMPVATGYPILWTTATSSFTVPESGMYMAGCNIAFSGYDSADGRDNYTLIMYKNGSEYCQVDDRRSTDLTSPKWFTMALHRILQLSKDDAITFYCCASSKDLVYTDVTTCAHGSMYIHRMGGPTF